MVRTRIIDLARQHLDFCAKRSLFWQGTLSFCHMVPREVRLPTFQIVQDLIGLPECVASLLGSFFSQSFGSICSSQKLISSLSKYTASYHMLPSDVSGQILMLKWCNHKKRSLFKNARSFSRFISMLYASHTIKMGQG